MSLQCHACGAPIVAGEPIPRDSECPSCRADLRSCRNCRHHDARYNNQCRETEAELVEDKHRRNFCEYFSFDREPFQPAPSGERAAAARSKLEALFGGPSKPDRSADARAKLESLFRKPGADDESGSGPASE